MCGSFRSLFNNAHEDPVRLSLCVGIAGSILAWPLVAQEPKPPQTRPIRGCDPAVRAWWKERVGTGNFGRIVCADDPTRPAILLFHGTLQDSRTWTGPSY